MICDMHSHLLPDIDDGSKSWAMTMEMIRISWESGVRAIIATPHNLPWEQGYPVAKVFSLCREVEKRTKDQLGISLPVFPGQEIYYHRDTPRDLENRQALSLAGSRFVLVEFGEDVLYSEVKYAVIQLRREGYIPIIAHVERFLCLREGERIQEIRDMGALLQSNIHALTHFGRFSYDRRWLKKQYEQEKIDFVSSDMHNTSSRSPIRAEDLKWFQNHLAEDYRHRIFWQNAYQLVETEADKN